MNHKLFALSVTIILLFTCCIAGVKTSVGDCISSSNLNNPVANANGPYYGIVNQPIIFDGSNSYAPEGNITVYIWDCGDGFVETGMITIHTYSQPGIYELILLITDDAGNYDCDQTEVIIYEDNPPILEIIHPLEKSIYYNDYYLFPYDNDTILIGKINVTANATDDVGISRVEFYIDDNLYYTDYDKPYNCIIPEGHLRHSLTVIAYDLTNKQTSTQLDFFQWKIRPVLIIFICYLILRDGGDKFNWISDEGKWNSLLITLLKNLADLDPSNDITIREFIEMLQNRNDDIRTSIIIDFLNNHPYLKDKFRKTYPFVYFILFYIKNENSILRDKILHSFYKDKNLFNILFSTPSLIELLKNSNIFNSNSQEITPIEWIKDHPFMTAGMILLLLLILNNLRTGYLTDDNNDTPEKENIKPTAKAGGPYIGYLNDPISFSAEGSYDSDGEISSYEWDFGDGSRGSGIKTQHMYTKAGNFTVTLTVTDDGGKTDIDYSIVEISDFNKNFENVNDDENLDYVVISGFLSMILLFGLAGLKFRRKFFE